ncbi:MAG: zeta toxin family protein [Candidatus Rokubacteria bacterium]|nr:zeta toxin family protein [Candidatus Rokubacteria bacterium]
MNAGPLESIRAALLTQPVLIFLAGPNGSGKTTFFEEYLDRLGLPYVNADRIARALHKVDPTALSDDIDRRAFGEAERLRSALLEARLSFCTETVFSDPASAKLRFLEEARSRGFAVFLVFIGLDSPVLAVARVKQRVEHGGHDIPDEKLRARFPRTVANLRAAIPIVDEAFLFDNSSYDTPYRVVAVYRDGQLVSHHPPLPPWTEGLPGL